MVDKKRKRILRFERLETKATPTALLLAVAPLDNACHEAVEQLRAQEHESAQVSADQSADQSTHEPACESQVLLIDTRSNWQFQISTLDVLRFVEENTCRRDTDTRPVATPSAAQCQGVDEMLKLDDVDVRALVIADSLAQP